MSQRSLLTATVAVIVSLTCAGPAVADLQVPADPGHIVGGTVEQADHLANETTSGGTDAARGDAESLGEMAEDTVNRAPSDLECQLGMIGEVKPEYEDGDQGEGDSCEEPSPDGEAGPDGFNETGSSPTNEILGTLDDLTGEAGQGADDAVSDAHSDGSNLIQAIWRPLQEVSQEAGRFLQDAYGTVYQALDDSVQSLQDTVSSGTAMAMHLSEEAEQKADDTVALVLARGDGLLGWLDGVVDGLLGPDDAQEETREVSQGIGTRSASVGTSPSSSLENTMMIAGGIGLALAGLAALRRLLGLGGAALLSRIPSSQLMKNGTRNSIYEIVRSDPGVSLNEIVDRVGLSRNAVAYHLAVFESEKLMTSVKDGKYRRYFLNGGRYVNGAKDVVAAIKNEKTLHVIRFITEHPGAIQKEVCTAVGTSPSATSWHIRRLERVGLVEKERQANTVRYKPGPNLDRYDLSAFGLDGAASVPEQAAPVSASA